MRSYRDSKQLKVCLWTGIFISGKKREEQNIPCLKVVGTGERYSEPVFAQWHPKSETQD